MSADTKIYVCCFNIGFSKINSNFKTDQYFNTQLKQEAHGPHRSPELTAVNMYM